MQNSKTWLQCLKTWLENQALDLERSAPHCYKAAAREICLHEFSSRSSSMLLFYHKYITGTRDKKSAARHCGAKQVGS